MGISAHIGTSLEYSNKGTDSPVNKKVGDTLRNSLILIILSEEGLVPLDFQLLIAAGEIPE